MRLTGFRQGVAILRRELLSLWVTPTAWVLLCVFLALQGFSFSLMVEHFGRFAGAGAYDGPVQGYFSSLFVPVSLLLICPALCMRSFAEERRTGTIELLLTTAVPRVAIVLGKFAALYLTYLLMWAPTVLFVVILRGTGVVDWLVVGSSYLGVATLGAAFIAVGCLMSAIAGSQFVALLLTTLALFGWFIVGIGERVFDPGRLLDVCRHLSLLSQLEDFAKGVVDTRRLVLDLSVVLCALFITVRVVDGYAAERGPLV